MLFTKTIVHPVSGFFVYRHLGLVGCNIVLMKRIYQNQQLENE